jgi:3-oxoacyl-[acyl-carrier protein] reductase
MISFVKSLAVELAPSGRDGQLRRAGWVDTEMTDPAMRDGGPRAHRGRHPGGRVASAEDVAGPILFLCSPLARHVTARC